MKKSIFITIAIAFITGTIAIPTALADSSTALENLKSCIADTEHSVCTLEDDITDFNEAIAINSSKEINLNGHSITGEGLGGAFFGINPRQNTGVSVKFTGTGVIEYTGNEFTSIAVYGQNTNTTPNVTNFTIDKGVIIKNLSIAFFVRNGSPNKVNYGATLDLYGTLESSLETYPIYVQGNIHNPENPVTINIHDGATISSKESPGIMQAGCANTNIYNATITGASGIAIKSGNLNVYGGTITGTSNDIDASSTESGQDVVVPNGSAIQVKSTQGDYGHVNINIYNGTLKSEYNSTIYEYIYSSEIYPQDKTNIDSIKISGGNFIAPEGVANIVGSDNFSQTYNHFISGGNFTEDIPSKLLAEGTIQTSDGKVMTEEAYKEYLEGQKESETTTNNNIENPKTEDKIYNYLIVLIISILGIGLLLKKYIKIN